MSDFASSLPVRTENNGDVAAKIVDGTITSQALAVDAAGKITAKLDDAAGNGITSQPNGGQQALDVGIDVGGVQIDPRQIRALTSADVVTANQGAPNTAANGWPVKPTDGTNSQSFTASGEAKVDMTSSFEDQNYGTVGATTLRSAAQIGNATGAADFNFGAVGAQTLRTASELGNAAGAVDYNFGAVGAQTIRVAAEPGNATGIADFNNGATSAQTLRVAANLAVAGANVTVSNPVPVTIQDTPGAHVNDYKDATAIAASASDNHDYTVTAGKTLHLNQLESSASGKAKMEVQIETGVATGVFTSKFVQFNSTATPNMHIELSNDILVAAGVRVRLIMTNLDKAAEDIYSTICGFEV